MVQFFGPPCMFLFWPVSFYVCHAIVTVHVIMAADVAEPCFTPIHLMTKAIQHATVRGPYSRQCKVQRSEDKAGQLRLGSKCYGKGSTL